MADREVEFLITGPGLPSSEIRFGEIVEIPMGDKILITRQAWLGQTLYRLVAGYKRSNPYPKGRINAILVTPIEKYAEQKKVRELVGGVVVFFS